MLIAIDAGGTSTRCALVAPTGMVIGYGRAGSGNAVSVGADAAFAAHAAAVASALDSAGLTGRVVTEVVTAMAGFSMHGDGVDKYRALLAGVGVNAPVRFESDALAGYCSGTAAPDGYVLISGTGAAAIRVEDLKQVQTSDGLGWLVGDAGSGFWIGREVVRAVLEDLDGRGPKTAMTSLLLADLELGAEALTVVPPLSRVPAIDIIMHSAHEGAPIRLARFAGLAFEALPDPVAERIVDEASAALAATVAALVPEGERTPVVACGGVLVGQPELQRRVRAALAGLGREVTFLPVRDGLAGAVTMALRAAGTPVDEELLANIHADLARLAARSFSDRLRPRPRN